ncbi:MAG: putative lipoprotein [Verrucomicrobia bacterium ADurb.Bin474]|nr:MAG: putative lipoprotein [Verrucomicrobia bacterium ADurb.Bin474]
MKSFHLVGSVLLILLAAAGCSTVAPRDMSLFFEHQPMSVLVLPPINHSSDIDASYDMLAMCTQPLCELGYYVYPVAVVDRVMKENGVAIPDEMHGLPLDKLGDVFGADAVLYMVIERYGSKYLVFASQVEVAVRASLVDVRTGQVLWDGSAHRVESGSSGLIEALVEQVLNQLTDQVHQVGRMAVAELFYSGSTGIPVGHRFPKTEP